MPAQILARTWTCAVIVSMAATVLAADQRVWTDSTGEFKVSAELVETRGDFVILRREDGEMLRVPLDRLSKKDQAYLKTRRPAEGAEEQPADETRPEPKNEAPQTSDDRPSERGGEAGTGAEAVRSIKEAALAFYQGLREPDRAGAREVLTETAQEMNRDPESPLSQLPTPDPGTRSILAGRAKLQGSVAEIPVRVSTGGAFHSTKLHMRWEEAQWKIFAISATYPDGEKSLDFESEPIGPTDGDPFAALVGQPMPLSGYTITGQPLDMSQFAGKVVLVDFWATWCGPCREEMPNILKNWQQYHDDGFDVVAISLDRDLEVLRQFVAETRVPWTVVADKDPRNQNEMAARYGVRAIPTLVLIGRDGKVAAVNCRGRQLEQELDRLIKSGGEQQRD